jgi:hypothetical protein
VIYVSGYLGNAMRRATSITPSQVAHAKYPAANLGSGLPSKPFRFNATGANVDVVADINFLLNQGLENWLVTTLPDDWLEGAGAGSITREAGVVDEGVYSAKITGSKEFYQDVLVLTGKEYELGAALHGDGVQPAYIRVQDLDTLRWLSTAAAWQNARTAAEIETANAWVDAKSNFTIESPSNAKYYTTLRIFCGGAAGGTIYIDDLYLIPKVSMTSVHGHNLGSGVALNLRASTDNFGASNVDISTPVMAQPAFYDNTFSLASYRYWKLLTTSQDVGDPIWMGEWALGAFTNLGEAMRWGWQLVHRQPRTDVRMSPSGQLYTRREAYRPSRNLVMSFIASTEADRDEVLEEVRQASEQGDEPVIMVPDTTDKVVIHGRVSESSFPVSHDPGPTWTYGMTLEEDVYPVAGF